MGKAIIGGIAHVGKINCFGASRACGIDHMAESGKFITFSSRLYDKVSKSSIKNRIKSIDMDLVKSPCGFPVRFKKSIRIVRVSKNITPVAIAGNELVFSVVKVLFELSVKSKEEIPKGILSELAPLFAKSSFRGSRSVTIKVMVKFFFNALSLHSEEENKEILKAQFSIPSEIPARMFGIKIRVVSEFMDGSECKPIYVCLTWKYKLSSCRSFGHHRCPLYKVQRILYENEYGPKYDLGEARMFMIEGMEKVRKVIEGSVK